MNVNTLLQKNKLFLILCLVVIILIMSAIISGSIFWIKFLTEMLITGLFALSIGLLIEYVGLLSFGHALFFGLGGYMLAYLHINSSIPLYINFLLTVVFSFGVGLLIGWLCSRLKGIQFAVATLAFAQLAWTLAVKLRSITNGEDGMPVTFSAYPFLNDPPIFLCIVAMIVVFSFFFLCRLVQSPFGYLLRGIKDNQMRVPFMGFSVTYSKTMIFAISGVFATISGVLQVVLRQFISPDALFWSTSGTGVVMVIMGGVGSLIGPLIGAGVFMFIQDWLSSYTDNWMIFIGILLILVMMFEPKGLIGVIQKGIDRFCTQFRLKDKGKNVQGRRE